MTTGTSFAPVPAVSAASVTAVEIAARADARITELERECSQWRDELRIYRETENKRIAELERSVTVRDTEIARLETDLELARRDAERYRWLRDQGGREAGIKIANDRHEEDRKHRARVIAELDAAKEVGGDG